jgi:hypothetical protein
VSDEDNCSTGEKSEDCEEEPSRFASYLTTYLSSQRELGTQARIYGLTWMPGTKCEGARNQGRVYAQAIEISGGRGGSICDQDYTSTLKEISLNVKSILQNSWLLKNMPDSGSLRVFIDNVEMKSGFELKGNSVTFTQAPAASAEIRFEYTVGAKPILTSFELSQTPHPDSLLIQVNGVDIQDAYSISNFNPRLLTLNNTAPEFSEIKVSYKVEQQLPKSFSLSGTVKPASVIVKVNDAEMAYQFDPASGIVTLSEAPDEGAIVKIDYLELAEEILEYSLSAPGAVVRNLTVVDVQTKDNVPYSFDPTTGVLSFQKVDFREGREISVSFDDALVHEGVYSLPQVPMLNSVRLFDSFNNPICETEGSVVVASNRLTLNCDVGLSEQVRVTYTVLTDVKTQFEFLPLNAEQCGLMKWQVSVNGVNSNGSFKRVGCTFTYTPSVELAPEAQILIQAMPKGG